MKDNEKGVWKSGDVKITKIVFDGKVIKPIEKKGDNHHEKVRSGK